MKIPHSASAITAHHSVTVIRVSELGALGKQIFNTLRSWRLCQITARGRQVRGKPWHPGRTKAGVGARGRLGSVRGRTVLGCAVPWELLVGACGKQPLPGLPGLGKYITEERAKEEGFLKGKWANTYRWMPRTPCGVWRERAQLHGGAVTRVNRTDVDGLKLGHDRKRIFCYQKLVQAKLI